MDKTQSLVYYEVDGLKLLRELTPSVEQPRLKYTASLLVFEVFQKLDGIK